MRAQLQEHERYLWAVAYRMLGVPSDADDVVQETFVRFLQSPPADLDRSIRPWLVRVATNLSTDVLRLRRQREYRGPWLPGPVPTEAGMPDPESDAPTPEARYGLLESLSYAFLLAAEELSETQRAVLVLRDVFGYSVRETAEALEQSEANVKVLLHRAHAAMRDYETARPATAAPHEQVVALMTEFFAAIQRKELGAAEALLADGVVELSDGGGRYLAAALPIIGAAKIVKFNAGLLKRFSADTFRLQFTAYNGRPALVAEHEIDDPRIAPLIVLAADVDAQGKIARLYAVLNPDKLTRVQTHQATTFEHQPPTGPKW